MTAGIREINTHGMNCEQARTVIDRELKEADASVYRIRVIHGYRGGTGIKRMLEEAYGFCRHPKVKRMTEGNNPGITELILREF